MSHFLRDMFSSADAVRQRQLEELNIACTAREEEE